MVQYRNVPGAGLVQFPDELPPEEVDRIVEEDLLPDIGPAQKPTNWGQVKAGVRDLKTDVTKDYLAWASDLAGFPEQAKKLKAQGDSQRRATNYLYPQTNNSIDQISNPTEAFQYLTENVARQAPQLAANIALMAATDGASSAMWATKFGPKMFAKLTAEGMEADAAKEAVKKASQAASLKAAEYSGYVGSQILNTAESYDSTGDPYAAGVAGAIKAGLDMIPQKKFLSAMIGEQRATDALLKRVGKGMMEGAISEGWTEGAQEGVDIVAEHIMDKNPDMFSRDNILRTLNSAVVGGMVGSLAGGASNAIGGKAPQKPRPASEVIPPEEEPSAPGEEGWSSIHEPASVMGEMDALMPLDPSQPRYAPFKTEGPMGPIWGVKDNTTGETAVINGRKLQKGYTEKDVANPSYMAAQQKNLVSQVNYLNEQHNRTQAQGQTRQTGQFAHNAINPGYIAASTIKDVSNRVPAARYAWEKIAAKDNQLGRATPDSFSPSQLAEDYNFTPEQIAAFQGDALSSVEPEAKLPLIKKGIEDTKARIDEETKARDAARRAQKKALEMDDAQAAEEHRSEVNQASGKIDALKEKLSEHKVAFENNLPAKAQGDYPALTQRHLDEPFKDQKALLEELRKKKDEAQRFYGRYQETNNPDDQHAANDASKRATELERFNNSGMAQKFNFAERSSPEAKPEAIPKLDKLQKLVKTMLGKQAHRILFETPKEVRERAADIQTAKVTKGPADVHGITFTPNSMGTWAVVALNSIADKTAVHEMDHVARRIGLYTDEELKYMADNGEDVLRIIKRAQAAGYKELDRLDLNALKKNPEERRAYGAEAYKYLRDKNAKIPGIAGIIKRAFEKVYQFIKRLRNAFNQAGFRTVEDVYEAFQSGQFAERTPTFPYAGMSKAEANISDKLGYNYFSDRGSAPTFFSPLTSFVTNVKTAADTADKWKSLIRNNAPKEEVEWSGVLDWLDGQKGKISKEAVLDFVRSNEVNVVDVLRGEPVNDLTEDERKFMQYYNNTVVRNPGILTNEDTQRHTELWDKLKKVSIVPTRHAIGVNVTKGGTEQRELLLTLGEPQNQKWIVMPPGKDETDPEAYIVNTQAEAIDATNQGEEWWDDKPVVEASNTNFPSYYGHEAHYKERNILSWVRFNTRQVAGKKTLFIEEIQSDWHQQGRKKGYIKTNEDLRSTVEQALAELTDAEQEFDDYYVQLFTKVTGYSSRIAMEDAQVSDADYNKLQTKFHEAAYADPEAARLREKHDAALTKYEELVGLGETNAGFVPDAPFKKSWPKLSMKRMIRFAAEQGYDQVAWTTGAMQNKRWGRDESPTKTGLEKFYDQELVDVANNLGKRFGVKVELSHEVKPEIDYASIIREDPASRNAPWYVIDRNEEGERSMNHHFFTYGEAQRYAEELPLDRIPLRAIKNREALLPAVWTMPVNEAMYNSVMAGQPLFAERQALEAWPEQNTGVQVAKDFIRSFGKKKFRSGDEISWPARVALDMFSIGSKNATVAKFSNLAVERDRIKETLRSTQVEALHDWAALPEGRIRDEVYAVAVVARAADKRFTDAELNSVTNNTAFDMPQFPKGSTLRLTPEQKLGYKAFLKWNDLHIQMLEDYAMQEVGTKNVSDLTAQINDLKANKASVDRAGKVAINQQVDRLESFRTLLNRIAGFKNTTYVPFVRIGSWGVSVTKAGETKTRHLSTFEFDDFLRRPSEERRAEQMITKLKQQFPAKDGFVVSSPFELKADNLEKLTPGFFDTIDGLMSVVSGSNKAALQTIKDKYGETMKEANLPSFLKRAEMIPGFNPEGDRAIYRSTNHFAAWYANLKTKQAMKSAIEEAKSETTKQYLQEAYDYINNPVEEWQNSRQLAFAWLMSDLSAAAVNLFQIVPAMSHSNLYAPLPKVMAIYARTLRDVIAHTQLGKVGQLRLEDLVANAKKAFPDIQGIEEAVMSGITFPAKTAEALGLRDLPNTPIGKLQGMKDQMAAFAGGLFSVAEVANRTVAYVAARRLLMEHPSARATALKVLSKNEIFKDRLSKIDPKNTQAIDDAIATMGVHQTQFLYGNFNRPAMNRGFGGVMFQFVPYTTMYLNYMWQMAGNYGPEGKKALAKLLVAMVITSGIWGLPFGENLKDMIELFYKFGLKHNIDINAEIQRTVAEASNPEIAEALQHGVFRWMSGIDIGRRIGLGTVPLFDDVLQILGGKGTLDNVGPPIGVIPKGIFDAWTMADRGDDAQALAQLMPKLVKNAVETYGWTTEGAHSHYGNVILTPEEVDWATELAKGFGFQPVDYVRKNESNYAAQVAKAPYAPLQNLLYKRLQRADAALVRSARAGDADGAKEATETIKGIYADLQKHNADLDPEDRVNGLLAIEASTRKKNLLEELGAPRSQVGPKKRQVGSERAASYFPNSKD